MLNTSGFIFGSCDGTSVKRQQRHGVIITNITIYGEKFPVSGDCRVEQQTWTGDGIIPAWYL